eukprot:10785529-Ditylum_brightwellii.AAC.1
MLQSLCEFTMLPGNFRGQDMEREKVHKSPAILFIPDEETMANIDNVKINLKVSTTISGEKNNILKYLVPKCKYDSLEDVILVDSADLCDLEQTMQNA